MTASSPIFEHHYARYLKQLETLDFDRVAAAAGAGLCPDPICPDMGRPNLTLTYFNAVYTVSARGIYGEDGEPAAYDTCAILSRYLIMAGRRLETGQGGIFRGAGWSGFRDLRDSGPLAVYFQDNVELSISRLLTGRVEEAVRDLAVLGAGKPDLDARYDLMLEFRGLPNIPLLLLFNDAEDGFPAACSVLFRPDVESHLDAECIAMMGYRLAALVRWRVGSAGINLLDPAAGMG